MKPAPGESDCLRLAAKAADREKAAEALRPAFEERLRKLGYSPLPIAHAFSALAGPDTVEEMLAKLEENERLARIAPVPLDFELIELEPALPVGRSLTITGVDRDGRGINIEYEIRPPVSSLGCRPRVEARDDCGQEYRGGGWFFAGSDEGTITLAGFAVPLPEPPASLLRVRMSWAKDSTFLWRSAAYEVRITL